MGSSRGKKQQMGCRVTVSQRYLLITREPLERMTIQSTGCKRHCLKYASQLERDGAAYAAPMLQSDVLGDFQNVIWLSANWVMTMYIY